jgi:chorismate mutase
MATKIDDQLLQQVQEAKKTNPHQLLSVIVTFTPGADLTALEQKGLKIHLRYQNIPAVAGTIPASAVEELAALVPVESIEADGQMRALHQPE